MEIEVTAAEPAGLDADVLAVAAGGALVQEFDELFGGRLARASAEADPVAMVHVGRELPARRVAVVALDGLDADGVRTAAPRLLPAPPGGRASPGGDGQGARGEAGGEGRGPLA